MSFSVGNVEFPVAFRENGSSDRIVKHPSLGISAYPEPKYTVLDFLEGPSLDRLVEANSLESCQWGAFLQ